MALVIVHKAGVRPKGCPKGLDQDVGQERIGRREQEHEEAVVFQMLVMLGKGDEFGEGKGQVNADQDQHVKAAEILAQRHFRLDLKTETENETNAGKRKKGEGKQ